MARQSPTQRTLKLLREEGSELVQVVERWNQFAQVRQDLFGIIDVLAVQGKTVIAVQATSRSNVSDRIKKILTHDSYPILRKLPNWRIEVHGWDKGPNGRYRVRREIITADPLPKPETK